MSADTTATQQAEYSGKVDNVDLTIPAFKKEKVTDGQNYTPSAGFRPRAFSCNVTGDLQFKTDKDDSDDVMAITAGVMYPIAIGSITGAGTTATGILVFA